MLPRIHSSIMLPPAAVNQLKAFIETVKANPDLLHDPSLAFFTDFLK